MATDMIQVQTDDFNLATEYDALRKQSPDTGAVVTFTGLVRDINQGDDIHTLHLEHYPGMTEKVLGELITRARDRWSLQKVRIIHRVGELHPGDQIVFVGVGSTHRSEAFAACEFLMDFLKTRAPFWKKEQTAAGSRWVDARDTDAQAAGRWTE